MEGSGGNVGVDVALRDAESGFADAADTAGEAGRIVRARSRAA